jgi:PKD repeat protein
MKRKITLLAAAFLLTVNCLLPTLSSAVCAASYTWTQTAPYEITFTNTSTGASVPTYTWNFGDSQTSNAVSPTHTYSAPGSYMVYLYMYDNNLLCCSVCLLITVTASTPCNMTISSQVVNTTCSTCPNGSVIITVTGGSPPYSYLWNTGDTTSIISGLLPGAYTVCVTDSDSCVQCVTRNVMCGGSGNCAANFSLTPDTSTLHLYWAVNLATGVPPLTYLWSWGDATYDTAAYPSHTYSAAGFYCICLTITDATGCHNMVCHNYQLARMDAANTMVYVNVVPSLPSGISGNQAEASISVYPNPSVDGVFQIHISNWHPDASGAAGSVEIYNVLAEKVYEQSRILGTEITQINISHQPAGIYFVQLKNEQQIISVKLLLQK